MTRRTLLYLGGGLLALALSTGGFFWYQHYQAVMNAEPIKIYKATKPRQVSETPSLQGEGSVPVQHAETSEAGHWHGDEWHAEPHAEPVQVAPERKEYSLPPKEARLREIEQYPEPLRTWALEGEALREEGDALFKNRKLLPREEFERRYAELAAKQDALIFKNREYSRQLDRQSAEWDAKINALIFKTREYNRQLDRQLEGGTQ